MGGDTAAGDEQTNQFDREPLLTGRLKPCFPVDGIDESTKRLLPAVAEKIVGAGELARQAPWAPLSQHWERGWGGGRNRSLTRGPGSG